MWQFFDCSAAVANSIVSFRLDYCNSLLQYSKLQRIQNILVLSANLLVHSVLLASGSHYIGYQSATVLFTKPLCLHIKLKTGQPVYLRDLLHYHQPARSTLRSSSQQLGLLYQPAIRINFQCKAFSVMALVRN